MDTNHAAILKLFERTSCFQKIDIPRHKMFESTYIAACQSTPIGSDSIDFSFEDLFLLILPFINIVDAVDRCVMNKDLVIKYLLKMVCEIDPGINFSDIGELSNSKTQQLLFKQMIIANGKKYKFNILYDYINNLFLQKAKKIKAIKKFLKIKTPDKKNFLIWCCKKGKSENFIIYLLDTYGEKCEPGQINDSNNTALLWACSKKMTDVALKLIDTFGMECKPGQINDSNDTALLWAYYNNMTDIALKLIDVFGMECKPGQSDNTHTTALIWACYNNMTDIALKLIDTFGIECKPEHIDHKGCTALILACQNKLPDVSIKLIDTFGMECKPGYINCKNHTAFLWTCKNKLSNVAIKMIDVFGMECNIGHTNNLGMTAIDFAEKNEMFDVLSKMISSELYIP